MRDDRVRTADARDRAAGGRDLRGRVDRGGAAGRAWSAVAGTGTWQCTTTRRGAQRNHDCVIRGGDRLLIVRAIAWRDSARVTAFLDEFRAAAPACVP